MKLKSSGNKGQLSKRIISIPEFDLNIIKQAFNKGNLQKISRDIGISATGDKDELWERIILKKGLISEESLSTETKSLIIEKQESHSNDVTKSVEKITKSEGSPNESKKLTFESLGNIIREWVPSRRYKTEETYQNDLRNYLELKNKLSVQEEAGITKVDILVENTFPIELKKNPKRSDFDRLSGQIQRHIETYGKLYVVICQLQTRDVYVEYKNRIHKINQYSTSQLVWIIK